MQNLFRVYDSAMQLNVFDPRAIEWWRQSIMDAGINVDEFFAAFTPFEGVDDYTETMDAIRSSEFGDLDPEDAQFDDETRVFYFTPTSKLAHALCKWYDCTWRDLAGHLRSGYRSDDTGRTFFVGGSGYDVLDVDMLGGSGDGSALKRFMSEFFVFDF